MMPEAKTLFTELLDKSPSELEQRRTQICAQIKAFPKGYDDPDVPPDLLHELVVITSTLRRRNAGPPKVQKPTKKASTAPKTTASDLKAMLDL